MSVFLLLLAALAIWVISATVVSVLKDGYRRRPTLAVASVRGHSFD